MIKAKSSTRRRFPPELAAFFGWNEIDEQAALEGEAIRKAFRSRLWRTVFEPADQGKGDELDRQ